MILCKAGKPPGAGTDYTVLKQLVHIHPLQFMALHSKPSSTTGALMLNAVSCMSLLGSIHALQKMLKRPQLGSKQHLNLFWLRNHSSNRWEETTATPQTGYWISSATILLCCSW